MFKNFKKKLMILISAVLVFTMIPSVAFADDADVDASDTAREFFENLTEDYSFENDVTVGKYILCPGKKMGHGTVEAKIYVKNDGTYDLELQFIGGTRVVKSVSVAGKSYNTISSEPYKNAKNKDVTDDVALISDFDPTLLIATSEEGFTHQLVLDVVAKDGENDDNLQNAIITFKLGDVAESSGNEQESSATLGVTINRTGNFSQQYLNSEFNKAYRLVSYDASSKTAVVSLGGSYSKMFLGTYQDASVATSGITTLSPENGTTLVTVPVSALDTAITVSLYQDNMGGNWRQYSFTFYKKEIKPTDVEETDTALVVDAKEETVVAVSVAQLVNATKPLEIKTKLGTVSFDTKAIAGFVAANTDNITFEMKDLKDEPIYKNSKYDMVLDLSLTDDEGNPIFTEGQGGKATITVPYEKEVPAGQKVVVYYIGLTGKEAVEATYDANAKTVTFTVEHFSTYAIMQEAATPSTGDNNMDIVTISLIAIAVAAAGVTGAVALKKKAVNK